MTQRYAKEKLQGLIDQLQSLHDEAIALAEAHAADVEQVPAEYRGSAVNLLHYLAVRQHDLRDLQHELHALGLSSLGRMEAYVHATLHAVLAALHRLSDLPIPQRCRRHGDVDFETGRALLRQHTEELLGPTSAARSVRVMVTMPGEAAGHYKLIRELVAEGMDIMRINCAADGPDCWEAMVRHLRRAERELERTCRVQFDLSGPNPRTGPIEPAPAVIRWRPRRNELGRVVAPARVWVTSAAASEPEEADAVLCVEPHLLADMQPDDTLEVTDTDGDVQQLVVIDRQTGGCWAEALTQCYATREAPIRVLRSGRVSAVGVVLEPRHYDSAQVLRLAVGDNLILTADDRPGKPALRDEQGNVVEPARIGCTLPEILRYVHEGQRFYYDDGELGGVVRRVAPDSVLIEVTEARKGSAKVRADKGINLPGARIDLPSLTEKDLADLDFIAAHGDLVGLSFVRGHKDVERVVEELRNRGAERLGIVVKIETQQAFDDLPRILLTALRCPPVGVMVARGDLGVEMGFQRMAEVQEELLWLCEAAHVPVIWATQVLERLAKQGLPSRAEVTDAAMSGRAECVMLNKGEHIVETVRFLVDVLSRMQQHQEKKQSMLRRLRVSQFQ